MKKGTVYILIILPVLTGCSFYGSILDYKKLCNATIDNTINERYDTILKTLNVDPADTVKAGQTIAAIKNFRNSLIENFGTDYNTWFMSATKKFSTEGDEPDITTVEIQIDNGEFYSVLTFIIDDTSGYLQSVNLAEKKWLIPDLTMFWLFGIMPLVVLIFNIFSIRRVIKSDITPKWVFILLCILLNIPSLRCFIDYPQLRLTADLSFQMLFGISFNFMGYNNYAMSFGLPIGSFIIHFVLYRQKQQIKKQFQTNMVE
jgi:hypothetical protein